MLIIIKSIYYINTSDVSDINIVYTDTIYHVIISQ